MVAAGATVTGAAATGVGTTVATGCACGAGACTGAGAGLGADMLWSILNTVGSCGTCCTGAGAAALVGVKVLPCVEAELVVAILFASGGLPEASAINTLRLLPPVC